MNLTDSVSECDKENQNTCNIFQQGGPLKKKIEKKTVCRRYKNIKTVEAIRKLTLDLK